MVKLRADRQRLLRVRHVFSDFLLPYGREDIDEVQEVYESIQGTVLFAKRTNVAMRHFVAATKTRRIGSLDLKETERAELHEMFASRSQRRNLATDRKS